MAAGMLQAPRAADRVGDIRDDAEEVHHHPLDAARLPAASLQHTSSSAAHQRLGCVLELFLTPRLDHRQLVVHGQTRWHETGAERCIYAGGR
eukprot:ctg_466.g247